MTTIQGFMARRILSRILIIVVIYLVLQCAPSPGQVIQPTCRVDPCPLSTEDATYDIRKTYQGRLSMRFPNYTVYLRQAPRTISDAITSTGRGSSVVYHGRSGLAWDGANYFEHPAYNRELVTQHHLWNRELGDITRRSWEPVTPLSARPTQNFYSYPTSSSAIPSFQQSAASTAQLLPAPWVINPPMSRAAIPTAPEPTDPYMERYGTPGITTDQVAPRIPRPTRTALPGYCGTANSVSTARQALPICQPQARK